MLQTHYSLPEEDAMIAFSVHAHQAFHEILDLVPNIVFCFQTSEMVLRRYKPAMTGHQRCVIRKCEVYVMTRGNDASLRRLIILPAEMASIQHSLSFCVIPNGELPFLCLCSHSFAGQRSSLLVHVIQIVLSENQF